LAQCVAPNFDRYFSDLADFDDSGNRDVEEIPKTGVLYPLRQ